MALSSPGIGSGLDVNGIVAKLMQAESQPLSRLNVKEGRYQTQISAYGSLSGALSSFQSTVANLSNESAFRRVTATSGDASILTGTATSSALAGSYDIDVTSLPQAQTLASTGQASSTLSLGNAATTLSFQFGTAGSPASFGAAKTVSIPEGSSLQAIASAVNAANIGVSASILNDGSASPYRLVFKANDTGAANSMSITTSEPVLQGIMSYDQVTGGSQTLQQTMAAQDANLTINNLQVSSASNSLTEVIPGVTLNLSSIGKTTLTVAQSTSTTETAVKSFVTAYNELTRSLKSLSSYDPATRTAGPLQGDATLLTIQSRIRSTLTAPVSGLSSDLNTLSQAGVSFQKDGTLSLDSAKLNTAMARNPEGVAQLFASTGRSTDTQTRIAGYTSATQTGSYALRVDAMATQGSSRGSVDLNLSDTIIGDNTSIAVSMNGVSAAVALPAGTYTASQFAAMLQTAINNTVDFSSNGMTATTTVDATTGNLQVTSDLYGATSHVSLSSISGTAASTFMGATPTDLAGTDVQGTLSGASASGSGQILTTSDGLQIAIEGGSTGDRGTVSFTRGYAYQLNQLIGEMLSSEAGIASRTAGINRSIQDIDRQRETTNTRLESLEKRYRAQFTQLDTLLSSMNQTSNYLTQQLAAIASTNQ